MKNINFTGETINLFTDKKKLRIHHHQTREERRAGVLKFRRRVGQVPPKEQ